MGASPPLASWAGAPLPGKASAIKATAPYLWTTATPCPGALLFRSKAGDKVWTALTRPCASSTEKCGGPHFVAGSASASPPTGWHNACRERSRHDLTSLDVSGLPILRVCLADDSVPHRPLPWRAQPDIREGRRHAQTA